MPQVGQGILKGMGITIRHLFESKVTRQYPEYKRPIPERSRGLLTVDMDRCIACLQCRSEEHTSELQSRQYLVCRLLLEKKKQPILTNTCLIFACTTRPPFSDPSPTPTAVLPGVVTHPTLRHLQPLPPWCFVVLVRRHLA